MWDLLDCEIYYFFLQGYRPLSKWRPIKKSFESIKISLTNLILKLVIQKNVYSETRLVRLI